MFTRGERFTYMRKKSIIKICCVDMAKEPAILESNLELYFIC